MSVAAVKSRSQWVSQFDTWAQGPSDAETQRCENAERMVREAIKASPVFVNRDIEVFAQGSYRNRTNIRLESDVDVCILCKDTIYNDYTFTSWLNNEQLGFKAATYLFDEFKNDIETALVAKFGRPGVRRGDKAFEVNENTYRVHADAVPAFEGRTYFKADNGGHTTTKGTVIRSDKTGVRIENFPKQHIERGIEKHDATYRRYKKRVRILKNLCVDMVDAGYESAKKMKSFLLESLVHNCPDGLFSSDNHYDGMKIIISHLWNLTVDDEKAKDMMEANRIKYLFRASQPWSRSDVNQFLVDAWNYVGFGS